MALPSHLLEVKKRMEAASKQESEEVKTESAAPVEQQPPVREEPVVESPQSDEVFALDVSDDDEPSGQEPAAQQPPQQSAEVEALKKEADQYKARWETLQGKFRKSEERVQALSSERAGLDSDIQNLRSKVSEFEKQIKQLTRKKLSEKIQESFSEEDRAIHGDTIPVISRVADQIQASHDEEIGAIRKELEERNQRDVESAVQSQIRSFHEAFRSRVPDADKVAADPSWQAFTAKRDKLSGKLISEIWQEHVKSMSVEGLVKVIDAWRQSSKASKAPAAPKTPSLSAAAPQPQFTEKGRFKYSDFKKASESYTQNIRDPAAKKSYEDAKRRLDDAKSRGLVDYAA